MKEYRDDNGRLHKEDGPAIEMADGTKAWYIHGRYHREDGPAYEGGDHKEWWLHGKCHREDGPAVEGENGYKEWYIHGKRIRTWKEYHVKTTLSPQEQMVVKLRYGEQLK